jgi:hypothetical protein
MPKRGFAVLICAFFCCISAMPAFAQVSNRLSQQRIGVIALGDFAAGDNIHFSLTHYRGNFLLRIGGDPEVYVLYADYGSLGGRVLRYDSGATAIQVAGWGAMTLYTDAHPDGLPAMRTGDAQAINLASVSQAQLLGAADDEASHLAYVRGVRINFSADWNNLAGDAGLRAQVYDTLDNTARGIARFAANPQGREAFTARIGSVHLQPGKKLVVQISGTALVVTYIPGQGYLGRASSRAIAFALGKMFNVAVPN